MAEALLISAIEKIGPGVAKEALIPACSQLLKDASPWEEVHSKLKSIKYEFDLMAAYIKYVDRRKDSDQRWQEWVKILRDLVYQLEDIMDEYAYLVGEQHRRGFYGSLHGAFRQYKHIKAWRGIRNKLKEVLEILASLSRLKQSYDIDEKTSHPDDSAERHRHRKGPPYFPDEDEIVGFDEYKKRIVGWLIDEEPSRTIVSVWGMGGLGKTTLVDEVYKSQVVKRHFDCRARVTVSQEYTAEDLTRRIIEDFFKGIDDIRPPYIDTLPGDRLAETLHGYLQQKRYLIVLDDVWHANRWYDEISPMLVDSKCGSRIVLTTRNQRVANIAIASRVHELQPLQEDDSWVLFCNKAFQKYPDKSCPPDLEYWARKILERCHGLPLAIVAAGSALSYREREELEWREFYEGFNWEDSDMPMNQRVKNILHLSFKDLPYHLRSCFLYCSMFPEDHLIRRKKLIRLWVAEGFVQKRKGISEEQEAEKNLNELIHRCLLQVVKRNEIGRAKLCRMHDLVRDLTLTISKQEYFGMVYNDDEAELIGKARRISIQKGINDSQSLRGMSNVRSLLMMFDMTSFSWKSLTTMATSFRLLRVLDLEGAPIEAVPDEVTILFNLHYLGLRKTMVKKLPRSLGRLRKLQTLDLYDSNIKELPHGITQLKNLRHLFAESHYDRMFPELGSYLCVKAPKGIWNLKNLQTLHSVEADEDMIRHMGNLTQMRTLRISRVRGKHSVELCSSISKMSRLVSLGIVASDEGETLRLENLKPPSFLYETLFLAGRLEHGVLPHWLGSLTGLRYLGLRFSSLREDPLPRLQNMPNLAWLSMYHAYEGQELCFHAGGFPKLKFLMVGGSNQLDSISMEEGALPNLSELSLARCGAMKLLPQGIEHLTSLQVLHLVDMPDEFIERMREGNGNVEERQKVQRIPLIRHFWRNGCEWREETLS